MHRSPHTALPRLVLVKKITIQPVSEKKSEAPEQRRPLNPILREEHPIIVLVAGPFFRIFEIVRCNPTADWNGGSLPLPGKSSNEIYHPKRVPSGNVTIVTGVRRGKEIHNDAVYALMGVNVPPSASPWGWWKVSVIAKASSCSLSLQA